MLPNRKFTAHLVTFTEEVIDGKNCFLNYLDALCAKCCRPPPPPSTTLYLGLTPDFHVIYAMYFHVSSYYFI